MPLGICPQILYGTVFRQRRTRLWRGNHSFKTLLHHPAHAAAWRHHR